MVIIGEKDWRMSSIVQHTKRETLLSTAQQLFARFGLKKTTVEEITRLTRIAKGTFYKYFPDKETLFLEVVERESISLMSAIHDALAQASSSEEKMRVYLLTKVDKISDLVNFRQVTREQIDEYWPKMHEVREKYVTQEQKIVRQILIEGMEKGELVMADPDATAYAIVIAVKGLESSWMFETCLMEPEEGVELLLSILMRGISKK